MWEFTPVVFRGTEDPNCMLMGFKIENGYIVGFDSLIDPNGENHSHATISNCVFQGNCVPCGTVIRACDGTIINCVLVDNVTNAFCLLGPINECHGLIKNCTIANNESSVRIGDGGSTTIENCIIYGNIDGEILVRPQGAVNILYSDIEGGLSGVLGDGTVNWGPGNIDTDPCFVRVGYWEYNEPNWILHEGDYHLQSEAGRWDPNSGSWVIDANTSACIDAGNPGCPPGSEPPPNGNRINMGAYGGTPTASKTPANWRNIADLTNDWTVDFNDLAVFVNYWLDTGKCIPSDLNRNQSVNFIDFDIFADNYNWP